MSQAADQVAQMSPEELGSVQKLQEAYAALRKEMDLVITMFIDGMKSHHSHLH